MADIPVWPATLPAASFPNGYSIAPGTPYVETDMDSGRTRSRRRFSRVPSTIDVVWFMSMDQYAVFEGFLEYEVGLGANWFQIDLLSGIGKSPMQVKFTGSPPFKQTLSADTPRYCTVAATLKVRRIPVASRDEYDVMKVYPASEISTMDDLLHHFIHVELPGPSRWD
ncbi:hypothetical protein [Burkholderia anthina]|uniref:hypothetical protein n=1 Tax=Burkholderia anthina TaxID=179879 RepID=UPI001AA07242|nr:hypothetical protein [Burkholderia anthina]QTD91755.1 hypothetical protein J4G50_26230 [Burkholderia anthina]